MCTPSKHFRTVYVKFNWLYHAGVPAAIKSWHIGMRSGVKFHALQIHSGICRPHGGSESAPKRAAEYADMMANEDESMDCGPQTVGD